MRVVWKDSNTPKEYEPIKYRGYYVFGSPNGWEVSIKGDNNLYKNHYCALNAIDAYFGEEGTHGGEKRIKCGIQIIGQKNKIG